MPQELDPGLHNLDFIEAQYARFRDDPESVSPAWRAWLRETFHVNGRTTAETERAPQGAAVDATSVGATSAAAVGGDVELAARAERLIQAYRLRGHLASDLDPLARPRPGHPELDPAWHGLDAPELVERLRAAWCGPIGVQYMHLDDLAAREWIEARMEGGAADWAAGSNGLPPAERAAMLRRIIEASAFEDFIQKKYLGAKRFSLEGAETLITILDIAIEEAAADGADEVVMGMAHRGRLNVLANVVGKPARDIFREFDDVDPGDDAARGDVKYHLGHGGDITTRSGRPVHVALCFNPSHLEFVNPVAMGRVRAKQDLAGDRERRRGVCVLVHGDAAFIAEGVVPESLNLGELAGYTVGGTLHVVVNNQLGFTTTPEEGRSSTYPSDVALMLQSPVFHVNGDDPDAVARVARMAMAFRREFRRDVFIDLWCYRRHGHNESDEPAFTLPVMYARIHDHPPVRERYRERLVAEGAVTGEEADRVLADYHAGLERELEAARSETYARPARRPRGAWHDFDGGAEPDAATEPATAVARDTLAGLLDRLARVPGGFQVHRGIERGLARRREMAARRRALDWAAGEALALATLAVGGTRIRLTGQDTARGTFSQRHAVFHDARTGEPWMPLANLGAGAAPVEILNSPLSELAAMGFEYGYSLDDPRALVLWEAQFGDFVNAAQVMIDQFLVSAEEKWCRLSGLVLLLPHGFEGAGPEHSSARIERFLELAVADNIQVAYPTTPAQYFHLLRRQALRPWRKPLIVMTPKSLLRHPRAVSPLDDLAGGTFRAVLPDPAIGMSAGAETGTVEAGVRVKRVLFCSGKIYYELVQAREERERADVAILRLEQLYPLRTAEIDGALAPYAAGTPVTWVQEEPVNMGAASALRRWLGNTLGQGRHPFAVIARPASASPAGGSAARHEREQRELIERAFDDANHDSRETHGDAS